MISMELFPVFGHDKSRTHLHLWSCILINLTVKNVNTIENLGYNFLWQIYDISSYKIHGLKWFNVTCFWKVYFKYFWKCSIHLWYVGIRKEAMYMLHLQVHHSMCLSKESKPYMYSEQSESPMW